MTARSPHRRLLVPISFLMAVGVLASPGLARGQVRFELLHSFAGSPDDGANPAAALIQATDGTFYGTTAFGGAGGAGCRFGFTCGTVFQMTSDGTVTLKHKFNFTDGFQPTAALLEVADGSFYGTTVGNEVFGEVFRMTPDGHVVVTHAFCDFPCSGDGANPHAPVILASDGGFYGTTFFGGLSGRGVIFRLGGGYTVVHRFTGADGANPLAALVEASDGTFYGTTIRGGDVDLGTVFQMTPDGTVTVVHAFSGADGAGPFAALIQASDGTFYGTTNAGGDFGDGIVFQMTPDGVVTTLYAFSGDDGLSPRASLLQAADGNLYGTTYFGGASGNGVVCRLVSTPGMVETPRLAIEARILDVPLGTRAIPRLKGGGFDCA